MLKKTIFTLAITGLMLVPFISISATSGVVYADSSTTTSGCTINGQPAACGKTLGLIAAIGIPLFIILGLFAVLWIIDLVHVFTHNDIPDRVIWIICLFIFALPVSFLYFFIVRRPYKRNHPTDVGTVSAAKDLASNITNAVNSYTQPPATQPPSNTPPQQNPNDGNQHPPIS
jgi:hypothetical protein